MSSKKGLTPGDIDRFTTNGLGVHVVSKNTPEQDALVRKYNAEMEEKEKKKSASPKGDVPGK